MHITIPTTQQILVQKQLRIENYYQKKKRALQLTRHEDQRELQGGIEEYAKMVLINFNKSCIFTARAHITIMQLMPREKPCNNSQA